MKKLLMLAMASLILGLSSDAIAQVAARGGQAAGNPVVLGNRPALANAALDNMARTLSGQAAVNGAAQTGVARVEDNPQRLQDDSPKIGQAAATEANVLKFDSMVGISGALVGADLIRGVPGGGQPWTIGSATGTLSQAGQLNLNVQGLVLTESGVNPAASFGATLSCQDSDGNPVNTPTTGSFPTDEQGNATISETIAVPSPCFAPVVFVTGPEGQWFAATGLLGSAAPTPQAASQIITGSSAAITPVTATQIIDPSVTATQLNDRAVTATQPRSPAVTATPSSSAAALSGTATGTGVTTRLAGSGKANTAKANQTEDRVGNRNKPEDNSNAQGGHGLTRGVSNSGHQAGEAGETKLAGKAGAGKKAEDAVRLADEKKLFDEISRLALQDAKLERKRLKDAGKNTVFMAKEQKNAGQVKPADAGMVPDLDNAIEAAPKAADIQFAKQVATPAAPVADAAAKLAPLASIQANAPAAKAAATPNEKAVNTSVPMANVSANIAPAATIQPDPGADPANMAANANMDLAMLTPGVDSADLP